jgi:hypothetical protein
MNNEENMGFGSNEPQSTWISINNGKLTVRAQEDDEGAVRREYVTKDGEKKTVWEYQNTSFLARMTNAGFEETSFGQVFSLGLNDGTKDYELRLPCPGRLFEQFAKRIPNINKESPLYIGAFTNEKGHNVLYLKQNGAKVEMAFTRDAPNGLPEPTKTQKMGKDVWDFSEQQEFLYQVAKNWWGGAAPTPEQETVPANAVYEDVSF